MSTAGSGDGGGSGVDGAPGRRQAGFGLVEVLVALVVLSAGMLGVAGLTGTAAEQTWRSAWETEQALVAQQLVDSIRQAGFGEAVDGADTLEIAGRRWAAAWTVTRPATALKRVDVALEGRRGLDARTFTTRLHRPLSPGSALPPSGGGGGGSAGSYLEEVRDNVASLGSPSPASRLDDSWGRLASAVDVSCLYC